MLFQKFWKGPGTNEANVKVVKESLKVLESPGFSINFFL